MSPDQWRRTGELLHKALEIPSDQRAGWVGRACHGDTEILNEVTTLLETDRRLADRGSIPARPKAKAAGRSERAGAYRLLRVLGRGGMGTVHLAERDDEQYKIRVAVKLVRPGMDTDFILQRFRRERQILAQLQHPHIARLLDGGTTDDGLPYIVMEYIEGTWITSYCRTHNLSIEARLKLFLEVCSAVEYAHRNLVVHRDIKPGNILVDASGSAKLLDFGICKLLRASPIEVEDTISAETRMLTPDYASPEQIRGDPVTVTSDVYSMAAVLYELLTETKPHRIEKLSAHGIEQAICEQAVVRPSLAAKGRAIARRLAGDLDNILLHALEKDPQRRYPSVEQFSEDVRRHLADNPVTARPATWSYRIGKFLRRRRDAVAAAAIVIAAIALGIVLFVRQAHVSNNLRVELATACHRIGDAQATIAAATGSDQDRQQARDWLGKSLKVWHEIETANGLTTAQRREMQEVETALSSLTAR